MSGESRHADIAASSSGGRTRQLLVLVAVAALAALGGWYLGSRGVETVTPDEPSEWLAKVGDRYIAPADFIAEMERRGGYRPGQYHDLEQKRLLLDDMIFRLAMVQAARDEGLDRDPEVRRSMESILINRYQQASLEPMRDAIRITPEEIQAYYEANADDYIVPARKRLAMIHIEVPEGAPEARWEAARSKAEQALAEARALDLQVPHFGDVARRFSDHRGSRYRGGVIGWSVDDATGSRFSPTVAEAAATLDEPGQISGLLQARDGFYIVRLVQSEPRRERSLDELSSGIRQRVLRQELRQVERDFRAAQLEGLQTQINESALASIEPLSAPGPRQQRPPAGPTSGGIGDQ